MIEILWMAVFLVNGNPVTGKVSETTKFQSAEECRHFGDKMAPRVKDWVRGQLGADWDLEVTVKYDCKPVGDPA